MVDSTPGEQATQPRGGAKGFPVAPLVATLLLLGLGAATSFIGLFFPWASANCPENDTHLVCDADGQGLLVLMPIVSAGVGLVLAVVGCVRWPRPSWTIWAIAGYTVTLIGFCVAGSIVSSAP
jgi:hypothetical protein